MAKTIHLTKGLVSVVDDVDFENLNQYRWSAVKCGSKIYAKRSIRKIDGTWTKAYMHRELQPQSIEVDHINGDTLDNRRKIYVQQLKVKTWVIESKRRRHRLYLRV